MKKLIAIASACLFLAACGDKVYDVDYYANHLDEAQEVVKKCAAGDMTGDNCPNAKSAISKNNQKEWMKEFGNK
jgi:hypothetical protein